MACHDKELSVLFTNDEEMAQLNRRYLGRKGPTNVLAFPMAGGPTPEIESVILGDVVISVDTAFQEAEQFGETREHVIDRLLIHGVLHLLDYDHEESGAEDRRMRKEEERLMALIADFDRGGS